MEDYIVRFYRRKEENGGLFGVVEEVGVEGKKAFRSMEELVSLLKGGKLEDRRKAERIRFIVPVTIEGEDSSGEPFSEETVIEDLNPRGAGFRLKTRVVEGDDLQLLIEPTCCGQRRNARVARIAEGPEPRVVEVVFQ
ncbi:MAG: PilZ domain-containing protein [Deltaproteobacteria bacterium]|nr:PilZ domain-containing protein [Deltaproteobacteria bacterium]